MAEDFVAQDDVSRAVQEMLFRYCRGLDRMDKPLALSVFHPRSELDYGESFKGSGPAFVDWVWEQHARATRHSHNITNLHVEAAADRASSEAYNLMMMRMDTPDGVLIIETRGRYLDEWVRHDGRWVIMKRQSIVEFQEMRRPVGDPMPAARVPSRRDRSDPSYRLDPPFRFAGVDDPGLTENDR